MLKTSAKNYLDEVVKKLEIQGKEDSESLIMVVDGLNLFFKVALNGKVDGEVDGGFPFQTRPKNALNGFNAFNRVKKLGILYLVVWFLLAR